MATSQDTVGDIAYVKIIKLWLHNRAHRRTIIDNSFSCGQRGAGVRRIRDRSNFSALTKGDGHGDRKE